MSQPPNPPHQGWGRPRPHGENSYPQNPYGGNPYAPNPYEQSPYGREGNGGQAYGGQNYGQPPYGPGGYPAYGGAMPPSGGQGSNGRVGLVVGAVLGLVLVVALVAGLFVAFRGGSDSSTTAASSSSSATDGSTRSPGAEPSDELLPESRSPRGGAMPVPSTDPDIGDGLPEPTTLPPGPLTIRYEAESSSGGEVIVTYAEDDGDIEQETVSGAWGTEFVLDDTSNAYLSILAFGVDGGGTSCRILVDGKVADESSGGDGGIADCTVAAY